MISCNLVTNKVIKWCKISLKITHLDLEEQPRYDPHEGANQQEQDQPGQPCHQLCVQLRGTHGEDHARKLKTPDGGDYHERSLG